MINGGIKAAAPLVIDTSNNSKTLPAVPMKLNWPGPAIISVAPCQAFAVPTRFDPATKHQRTRIPAVLSVPHVPVVSMVNVTDLTTSVLASPADMTYDAG